MPATGLHKLLVAQRSVIKAVLWLLALVPLLLLGISAVQQTLGPDPAEALADQTGELALGWLCACLAITPLRLLTGSSAWLAFRRLLGLLAFFYACVHLLVVLVFLLGLDRALLVDAFTRRPYITAGIAAWLCLLPLALTSTHGWQRRLGRRWPVLHRLVYVAASLALLHVWWQVRSDYSEALQFTAVLVALVAIRLLYRKGRFI
ncbi:MAG: sulfoxide reductase heme-binding subunit YedZ [Pseudomonadales bacterium]|nr:sulfoxide reductase heme-binding subunit YedZ [Pseudomonadales bacterium]